MSTQEATNTGRDQGGFQNENSLRTLLSKLHCQPTSNWDNAEKQDDKPEAEGSGNSNVGVQPAVSEQSRLLGTAADEDANQKLMKPKNEHRAHKSHRRCAINQQRA